MTKEKLPFFRYENGIIIILFLVSGLLMMDRLSIIFLFPFIATEIGLNNTQMGMLVGVTSIAWGVATLIFASLSDFLGTKKKMMIIFILLFSITTFAAGLVGGLASLIIVRILMGITEGPVIPLVQSTMRAESTPSRRGFNMGFIQSSNPLLGSALAPVIVVAIASAYNWRYSFFALAIPGIILAIVLMFFMREPIRQSNEGVDGKALKLSFRDYLNVFKTRNVWLNMIITIFFLAYLLTFTSFMPLFLTGVGNYTEAQFGLAMVVYGVSNFFWTIVIPFLSDKFGRKTILIPSVIFAIFLPIMIANFHSNFGILLVLIFIFAIGLGTQSMFMYIIPAESVNKVFAASAISIVILTGEIIGGTLGPVLAGMLADKYSLYAPLWLTSASAVIIFLLSFALKETAPVKVKVKVKGEQSEPNFQPDENIELS